MHLHVRRGSIGVNRWNRLNTGCRTDLRSHSDRRTPWSRCDLSARHESVITPFRRGDMTLLDVPSSKDASSALMKGSVGVEKYYDSLPKEERMLPALSTTMHSTTVSWTAQNPFSSVWIWKRP